MVPKSVPTYSDLFGLPVPAYEDLLRDVAPGTGIVYCISLNGELTAPMDFGENQMRLFCQAISVFAPGEQASVVFNLQRLARLRNDPAIGEIFFKQFILAMLVKELNRAAGKPITDIPTSGQYNLLQAYFITVGEQYKIDRALFESAVANGDKPDREYRMLWGPLMRQFQLNEWVSPLVEMSKLFWLMKFAFDNWREHLSAYLHGFGHKTIGQFAGSYQSLFKASMMTLPDKPLKKFIIIGDAHGAKHLAYLRINELLDKPRIRLRDLKKKPVFQLPTGQYLIIDKDYLHKHIFRGPFFDLQRTKEGKPITKNYMSDVSTEVMEKYAFRSILKKMDPDGERLFFDDGKEREGGTPDGYKGMNKTIFLIESKATIFPDELWETPDHDKFRNYLEDRFVKSPTGPKGVGQLANNIRNVLEGGYEFDPIAVEDRIGHEIYPVLVHNDFQFSMPGINHFLQGHFQQLLTFDIPKGVIIHPVTVINLDWLFDLSLRKGTFRTLKELIDEYHRMMREREALVARSSREEMQEKFVAARESFDMIYQLTFMRSLPPFAEKDDLGFEELFAFAGLTQEILETEV